jgi:hypothetical protein
MSTTLKYIVDDKGHKTSVLVPVKTWNQLNDKYQKLTKKLSVLTGIQNGLKEVLEGKKSGKSLQTLSDFLNESNS